MATTDAHPLDRPIWAALTGRQATLARGDARAWRLDPDHGYFAAAADASPASQAALAQLIPTDDVVWLLEDEGFAPPPGTRIVRAAACRQMVAAALTPAALPPFEVVDLGEADGGEMRALATLTEPGPFLRLTHRLGGFVGVQDGGRLVAMAGERLKPPGFTEVSGVCTHPDHRGRGYAGGLMRVVAGQILARGETPYLTVYASNTGAIALYETLGFRIRRTLMLIVLARA